MGTAAGNRSSPRHDFISVHMLLKPNLLIFRLIRHSVSANGQRASREHLRLSNRTAAKGGHTRFIQHILHNFAGICVTEGSPLFLSTSECLFEATQVFFPLTFTSLLLFRRQCWCLRPLTPPPPHTPLLLLTLPRPPI